MRFRFVSSNSVMSCLCAFLLVTTSPLQIDVFSSRARADVDFLHKDLFAQRALCDADPPTSQVVRPNDSHKWVSLVDVANSTEGTQRHVMDEQYVWVRAKSWCPLRCGRILLHLRIGASRRRRTIPEKAAA